LFATWGIKLLVTYIDDDACKFYSELELRDLNAYCFGLCLFIYLYVITLSVVSHVCQLVSHITSAGLPSYHTKELVSK
jgi:hypothetical protein